MSSTKVNAGVCAKVVKSFEQLRIERDHHQQYVAKRRYTALRKEIPKSQREKSIKLDRSYKMALLNKAIQQGEFDAPGAPEVKEQGFGFNCVVGAMGVAVSAAALNIVQMRKEVIGVAEKVDEAMASTSQVVINTANSLLHRVNSAIESFANTAKSMLGVFWVVPTAILAHYIIGQFADVPLLPLMASMFLGQLFGKDIWALLQRWFSPSPQSGEDLCSIGGLIISAVCAICVPMKSAAGVAGEVMKRMSSYVRAKEGFEAFFKDALKYAEKAVNAVLALFSDKQVNWIGVSERLVQCFADKVTKFEALVRTQPDKVQLSDLLTATATMQEAIGLKLTVRDPQTLMRIERGLTRMYLLLMPYQGAITAARNFRPEPTFICLYGGSGVGKTTLATKLACAILVKAGLCAPEEALRNLWQKGSTEYWNGYANQQCLVMDDCFQVKPVKGELDSEYMNVIRMIGSWAYALNFADLESKGKFYFDTPLVVGTTNCDNIYNMAGMVLTEPAAVVRRIKYPFRIEVSKEWQTAEGTLDYDRLEAVFSENLAILDKEGDDSNADVMDAYPWEAWTLTRHNFADPQQNGQRVKVRDLIEEVVLKIQKSRVAHDASVANLNNFMSKIGAAKVRSELRVKAQSTMGEASEIQPEIKVDGDLLKRVQSVIEGQGDWELSEVEPTGLTESVCNFAFETPRKSFEEQESIFQMEIESPQRSTRSTDFYAHVDGRADKAGAHNWRYTAVKALGTAIYKRVKEWVASVRDFFSQITLRGAFKLAFSALVCTVVIGLAVGAVATVRYIVKSIKGRLGGPRGKAQSNIKDSPGPARKTMFKPKSVKTQSDMQRSRIHDNIFANTFKLVLHADDRDYVVGQVQFVQLHVAMMPKHFRRQMQEKMEAGSVNETTRMSFVHATHNQIVNFQVGHFLKANIVEIEDTDLLFMRFPNGFLSAASKITQHFLKAEDLNKAIIAKPPVRLDVAELTPGWDEGKVKALVSRRTMQARTFEFLPSLASQCYENANVLEYELPTEEGMCGAPLCIVENRHYGGACYLGMHVAGAPGWFTRVGYSNLVTREQALEAIKELDEKDDLFHEDAKARGYPILEVDPEEQSGLITESFIRGSFTLIGKVSKPVGLNPVTKLKLSPIGENEPFGPNLLAPARLRPFSKDGERVSPMAVGLSGYASPLDYRPLSNMDAIVSMATKPFRELSRDDYRGILTKVEAVEGIEGMKLKPIARGKSPGYPFVHEVKNGKREFFGVEGPFEYESQQCKKLFDRVDHVVESAKKGQRLCHIFTDFLKDETRPMHKVEAGETRVISGAPIDLVIATRMYFGAWMGSMFRHSVKSGVAPGINPYREWYVLASRLCSKGRKVFDGDFKGFDKSEQPYVHYAILDFINAWYGGTAEDNCVREVLWMELVHSRHLGGDGVVQDIVYQWSKAMPSGHPLTTPVNSMYSLITLTGCYVKATGDHENMWDSVFINTFGDDNINNISDAVSEVFNQVTVARDMEELFGLTYTSGSKTGELVPYTNLESCTFLKRSFVRDTAGSGGWVAPIDMTSHLFSSYYYKNKRDPCADMAHNLEEMLGELSLHSVDVWAFHSSIAIAILKEMGRVPRFLTRDGYRAMMSQRIDAWF